MHELQAKHLYRGREKKNPAKIFIKMTNWFKVVICGRSAKREEEKMIVFATQNACDTKC